MAKKNVLDALETQPAAKVVARETAEKQVQRVFRVTPQQLQRIKEAVFISGVSMQDIVVEGIELWIEKNLKGQMK